MLNCVRFRSSLRLQYAAPPVLMKLTNPPVRVFMRCSQPRVLASYPPSSAAMNLLSPILVMRINPRFSHLLSVPTLMPRLFANSAIDSARRSLACVCKLLETVAHISCTVADSDTVKSIAFIQCLHYAMPSPSSFALDFMSEKPALDARNVVVDRLVYPQVGRALPSHPPLAQKRRRPGEGSLSFPGR